MRMLRKSGPKRTKTVFIGTGAVIVLLLFQVVLPRVLPNFLYQVATPVIRGWDNTADFFTALFSNLKSKQTLVRENEVLVTELATAREELLMLDAVRSDLKSLQVLYERQKENPGILAAVLLAPPLSPYDTLVLDVGVRNGVEMGSVVRLTSGIPIGKITEVFRDFSRAELLSSPGVETAVRIGEENVQARAIGVGDGEFQLLLPREFSIAKGDIVSFPELSASALGLVESIDYQETDFLQLVSFRSPVNLRMLTHVLIDSLSNDEQVAP